MKNKIVVFFIVLIALFMGGLLIYDRYIKEPEVCKEKTCEVKYPYTSLESDDGDQIINSYGEGATVSIKADGVYLSLHESTEASVQTIFNNLMANGDIKLDLDNVAFAYALNTGFTIYADYFAFIHNDGTVSVLSIGEIMTSGTIEVKEIEGLNNIINIYLVEIQNDPLGVEHKVIAVDINGAKHEVNMPLVDQW